MYAIRSYYDSAFLTAVEEGRVREVTIQGPDIKGKYQDDTLFKTFAPDDPSLIEHLRTKDVVIQAQPTEDHSLWFTVIVSWGPILLLIAVWIFFMRQMQSGA